MTLPTHHLQFAVRATTDLALDTQSGSAIRGALTGALWGRFCANKTAPTCAECPLIRRCPVAALVAPLRDDEQKGSDQRPRPYVIRPPQRGPQRYAPGDRFTFGVGLFGAAAELFPYVVLAAHDLEQHGMGRKLPELGQRRGKLVVETISAVAPMDSVPQVLYQRGVPLVQAPGRPMTAADVTAYAATLPTDRLTLRLQTPLRLVDDGQLVRHFALRPLIQRLMRRLDDLSMAYGSGSIALPWQEVLAQAAAVHVASDRTRWVDVVSHSTRQGRSTPIGGLIGAVTLVGNLARCV
ncbi:MAG: hypothetical protein HC893_13150, partial [Chloroflexaceae bacterium]|nr:hypothetical protein [Chloroflexaceae bacterium]